MHTCLQSCVDARDHRVTWCPHQAVLCFDGEGRQILLGEGRHVLLNNVLGRKHQ